MCDWIAKDITRQKQPYSSVTHAKEIRDCVSNVIVPTVCEVIAVWGICVFMFPDRAWKIGKVLQFATLVKKKGKPAIHRNKLLS